MAVVDIQSAVKFRLEWVCCRLAVRHSLSFLIFFFSTFCQKSQREKAIRGVFEREKKIVVAVFVKFVCFHSSVSSTRNQRICSLSYISLEQKYLFCKSSLCEVTRNSISGLERERETRDRPKKAGGGGGIFNEHPK